VTGRGPLEPVDPVVARRTQVAHLSQLGKRLGYGLYGLAVLAFVVGITGRFTDLIAALTVGALGLGSIVLLPSIVLGYAVRAAEREDRPGH
jgi:hypothetical protein